MPENDYQLKWLKNNRYYSIYIQPNLFGGASVIKVWGSSASKRSGHKIIFCASAAEISKIIEGTAKRRKDRHYVQATLTWNQWISKASNSFHVKLFDQLFTMEASRLFSFLSKDIIVKK